MSKPDTRHKLAQPVPCVACQSEVVSLFKQDFCSVGNFTVLIPYQDLEKIMETINNLPQMQADMVQMHKELRALRIMYGEALQKIAEINRFL